MRQDCHGMCSPTTPSWCQSKARVLPRASAQLLAKMAEEQIPPNVVTLNTALKFYARTVRLEPALQLLCASEGRGGRRHHLQHAPEYLLQGRHDVARRGAAARHAPPGHTSDGINGNHADNGVWPCW